MTDITGDKKAFYGETFCDENYAEKRISGKEFDGCQFESCDFSAALLLHCAFIDCTFNTCNLSVLNVANSTFQDVEFLDCKVLGVDWTKAEWGGLALGTPLAFKRCMLNSSSFYGLSQPKIVIEHCKAHDVDFREADLGGANFSHSDLSNSLFSHTDLTGANFDEALNYDIDVNNNVVKNARFSRNEAVRLLASLGIKLID